MCLLFSSQSWVLMASVMYGTIGLALDIATLVQEATLAEVREAVVILEGLSGVLNFLLIACGGYAFLSATMVRTACSNPSSQSSVPFFILIGFTDTYPAWRNHLVVSRTEYVLPAGVKSNMVTAKRLASAG